MKLLYSFLLRLALIISERLEVQEYEVGIEAVIFNCMSFNINLISESLTYRELNMSNVRLTHAYTCTRI